VSDRAPCGGNYSENVSAMGAYEFRVSAPRFETFAWLHGRAEKSGDVVSVDSANARFAVLWRGSVVPDSGPPASMEFAVEAGEHASLVTVAVEAETEQPLDVIEDFAGPLGGRMFGLRVRPPGFFDPPRTRWDNALIIGWAGLFAILLVWSVSTRRIPPDNVTMTGAQLLRFLSPLALAGLAAGVAGGLFVRRHGRWYESWLGGLLVGWPVSYLVLDVWLNDAPGCASTPGCDLTSGFGAALAAVPETVILLCGIHLGRAIAATATLAYRSVATDR
jgi:hypothetical protein